MKEYRFTVGKQQPGEPGSLDLGFGHTKGKRGKLEFSFQSITGPSRSLIDADLVRRDPLNNIHDLKRNLFVGDLALRQSSTKNFSLKEQKADQAGIRSILESALALMSDGSFDETFNLVSGLPVTFYFDQKEQLEQLIKGSHELHIKAGEEIIRKTVIIDQVKVVPQPLGSAMDFLLDDQGDLIPERKSFAAGSIGILDVGFFTNDLLVINKMEIIKDWSRSLRSGMSVAYKAISEAGVDLPIYELDKQIRSGKYHSAAAKAFAALADQIRGEIETYWGELDLILVTGGGGVDLFPFLDLPGREICLMDQMSNVKGYHKIGMRSWR